MLYRLFPLLLLITLLTASGAPLPTDAALTLSVDVAANRYPINPLIYGMNANGMADGTYAALAEALQLPIARWGGNATTRYNWQNDFYSTASDWFFENVRSANPDNSQLPVNSAADRFVQRNRTASADTLMTLPMIGYVAKDSPDVHPFTCGYKVSKYGAQQLTDPYDLDCGNGITPGGTRITGNNPADTSIAVGPPFVQAWVAHLVGRFGTAASSGVRFYALDNEPGLWPETHRDLFPNHLSYEDLRDRTIAYATAIRAADPTAQLLGPDQDGWTRYFYSSYGSYPDATAQADRDSHGGMPFVAWYLQQLRQHEQSGGVRPIDYFDLHYYPQAPGIALQPAGNATTQALRLRSTRALWDPTYVDESWIRDTESGNTAVYLLPRMRAWRDQYYPELKLAITEYNWGALDSINGALAQADVLGIFGRERLDLATIWDAPGPLQPGAFAFRMYRNYDNAGSTFGDTSVHAVSEDQGRLAVYAAQRGSDDALTLIVINKSTSAEEAQITLAGFAPAAAATVYRYSAANLDRIVHSTDQPVTASGFAATIPASSITLFVIPGAATMQPHYLPYIGK